MRALIDWNPYRDCRHDIIEYMSWYLPESSKCPYLGKISLGTLVPCSVIKHKSRDYLSQIIAANLSMVLLKGNPLRNTSLMEKETKDT